MTQPMNMGQMLGLLINIKELQERGRAREQQAIQFAQSIGVEKAAQIMNFMDKIAKNPQELKPAMAGIAKTLGWDEQQTQAVEQFIMTSPESADQLRERFAREGVMNATPQQTARMQQEAAFGATTGMSQGGAAQSGVQAFLASDGDRATLDKMWQDGFADSLRRGFVTQQARPMQGAIEEAAIAGGLPARAAGIQFGGDLTAAQQGSLNLQAQGLGLERIRMTQAAEAEAKRIGQETGLTMGEIISAMTELRLTQNQMSDPDLDDKVRELARRKHNSLTALLGLPQLAAPKKGELGPASAFDAYMSRYGWRESLGSPAPMTTTPGQPTISAPVVPPIVPDAMPRP